LSRAKVETIGKDHGRFEVVRTYILSHVVDWYATKRSYPGAPRFPQLTTIAWSRAKSSAATKSRPNSDPISPPVRSRPQPSRTAHGAIGGIETTFTGPST